MRVLIALIIFFAGCVGTVDDEPRPEDPVPEPASEPESEPEPQPKALPFVDPVERTFTSNAPNIGEFDMQALHWMTPNATTLIILMHGFYGTQGNYWDTLPEAGYSMPDRLVATGRAVLTFDFPSYGASDVDPNLVTFDVLAIAADDIADEMRSEYPQIVGAGLSMGGFVSNIAQGQHGSFDAIIPISAPHSGSHDDLLHCFYAPESAVPGCPEDDVAHDFVRDNAEPEAINATMAGYEDKMEHGTQAREFVAWYGSCAGHPAGSATTCQHPTPYDEATEPVAVPVFAIQGIADRAFRGDEWADEVAYYPNAPDVRVHGFPDVGHFVHNHLIQPELVAMMDGFLDDHRL